MGSTKLRSFVFPPVERLKQMETVKLYDSLDDLGTAAIPDLDNLSDKSSLDPHSALEEESSYTLTKEDIRQRVNRRRSVEDPNDELNTGWIIETEADTSNDFGVYVHNSDPGNGFVSENAKRLSNGSIEAPQQVNLIVRDSASSDAALTLEDTEDLATSDDYGDTLENSKMQTTESLRLTARTSQESLPDSLARKASSVSQTLTEVEFTNPEALRAHSLSTFISTRSSDLEAESSVRDPRPTLSETKSESGSDLGESFLEKVATWRKALKALNQDFQSQDDEEDDEFLLQLECAPRVQTLTDPSVSDVQELRRRICRVGFDFLRVLSMEEIYKQLDMSPLMSLTMVKAAIYVHVESGIFESLARELIVYDMGHVGSAFEICRTNTDQVRTLTAICKSLGRKMVVAVAKPVIQEILSLGKEVDLMYGAVNTAPEETFNILVPLADKIISLTLSMLTRHDNFELKLLRFMFRVILQESLNRFPAKYCGIGVISILFLRTLCPVLISPEDAGLINRSLTPQEQKNLIALAKLVQTIAGSYSQTERVEDMPEKYQRYIGSRITEISDFFTHLLEDNSPQIREIPQDINTELCVRLIGGFLQDISRHIPSLQLVSNGSFAINKSGGSWFFTKSRKCILSAVHAKLFYIRPDTNHWSGCIDMDQSRFAEPPRQGLNLRGVYFEVRHSLGEDMLLRSWRRKNGELSLSTHKSMMFWCDDRAKLSQILQQIHELQRSLGATTDG